MRRHLFRRPALVLGALLLAIMFDVVAMGSTVLPHVLAGVMPDGPYGYRGFRPEQTHAITIDPAGAYEAEFAWAAFFVRSIRSGSLPFWNPYQGLGQPQLANYVPAILFPVNWLTLVLPPAWWDLVVLLDWFLAAYFVYLLGRMFAFGRWGALAGAISMFAAGFFPAFLEVRSIVGTVSWFPCLIYAIERSFRQPRWRWKPVVLAGATYCLATGGHPSPALFGLLVAMMYLGIRILLTRRLWREACGGIVPHIALGGLMAAPLLLPFAEHVLWDALPTHTPGRGLEHFPWQGLPMTVFPFLYGPMNYTIWGPVHAGMTWMPASVTCLAVFGLFALNRRKTPALVALTVPVVLVAAKNFGVPIINDIARLPFFDQLTITYSLGIAAVGVAVLAGRGFTSIIRRPVEHWRGPLIAWGLYVAAMLALGVWTMHGEGALGAREPWRVDHYHAALASGLFWAIAFPASLVLVKRRQRARVFPLVLVGFTGLALQAAACYPSGSPKSFVVVQAVAATAFGATVLCALLVGARLRATAAVLAPALFVASAVAVSTWGWPRFPDRYDPLTPAPFVNFLAGQWNEPRLYPLDGVLSPDFGSALGLSSITNLDNLITKQGAAFITKFLDQGVFPARFFGQNVMRNPGLPDPLGQFWAHKRYWDLIGVRYLLTTGRDPNDVPSRPRDPATPDLQRVYWLGHRTYRAWREPDVAVWENTAAFDRAFLAPVVVPVNDPDTAMARLSDTADLRRTVFVEGGSCVGNAEFRPDASPGRLASLRLSANRVDIRYEAATAGVLTLTDAHARGWRVRVDGRDAPLLRVDGAFRGVCLEGPGVYNVAFVYRPPDWGLALGLCSVGVLGVIASAAYRRRRRAPYQHPPFRSR